MRRSDGRKWDELRPVNIVRGYLKYAEGSALIEVGDTRVICAASVEDRVPLFLRGTGKGWITAEYGMLPRATRTRNARESTKGRPAGRTLEIQRLIGRALRSMVDLSALGERTIWIDCDVIQADGGTRTASVTGSFVALVDALRSMKEEAKWNVVPVRDFVAATSVGIVDGRAMLDLNFEEDSRADVDMNIVMAERSGFVEVQGTGEASPFGDRELNELLSLARLGVSELIEHQKRALANLAAEIGKWAFKPVQPGFDSTISARLDDSVKKSMRLSVVDELGE